MIQHMKSVGTSVRLAVFATALAFAGQAAVPSSVLAQTAADATILNVVTVDYSDASGTSNFQATASSSVTVNLVEAAATVSGRPTNAAPGDTAVIPIELTVDSGATASYLFAITANSNGGDTYDLSAAIDAVSNVSGETATTQVVAADGTTAVGGANPATVDLGGSVITNVTGLNTLEFPGGTLNNIALGDIVVVDGVDYEVGSVTAGSAPSHDNTGGVAHVDVGTTTAEVAGSLTLIANTSGSNTNPAFGAPLVGEVVAEQILVTVDVTAITTVAGTDGTVDFDLSVNPDGDPGLIADVQDHTTTFTAVNLSIQKDVRNVTAGGTFAASAAGDPGDVLEYQLTITNNGGNATAVIVTDTVPDYTTLQDSAFGAGLFAQVDLNAGGAVDITTASNDDANEDVNVGTGNAAGTAAGSALNFYVGAANSDASDTGGTMTGTDTVVVIYQVQID
jgi:uncharacterized repeat protein (TIGR01451 family)